MKEETSKETKDFKSLREMEFDILKKKFGQKAAIEIMQRAKADRDFITSKTDVKIPTA